MIPDPHTSPLTSNGTKRTSETPALSDSPTSPTPTYLLHSGLKISFSQPNLRKAGQMNLKFPATGYEAAPEKFSIYSKV